MAKTRLFELHASGYYLIVHDGGAVSDQDWSEHLRDLERESERIRGCLVYPFGSAPTSKQRRALADMWVRQKAQPRISVLMSDVLIAHIVTAMTCTLRNPIRAFAQGDESGALDLLGVPADERASLIERARALRATLDARETRAGAERTVGSRLSRRF